MNTQAVILTQDELQALCPEWQETLGLRDWHLDVKITRHNDMPMEDKQATVTWNFQNRTATVFMLDPIDYPPEAIGPQDMERDLVHELIHLPFSQVEHKNDTAALLFEQGIEALAVGYVTLKRAGR